MGSNKKSPMPMGIYGTSSEERIMPEALSNAAARFVDSLKINSISEEVRRGRPVVIKRTPRVQRAIDRVGQLIFSHRQLANPFLDQNGRLATLGINCFKMLNGDRFRASSLRNNAICIDRLPGESLWEHLIRHTLTRRMVEAAGSEFRRAHQFRSKNSGDSGLTAMRVWPM